MKKLLMSVLGLMLMFTVACALSAEDQKPPKAKVEELKNKMTDAQAKQYDQLRSAEKDAAKAYKEGKTDENAQKLKAAIKARIEFVDQVTKREPGNIDEMVENQFKKITEGAPRPDKKGDKAKKQ